MKERNTLLQQPIVDFTLLFGNNAVACLAQVIALYKRGEAFYDEDSSDHKRDLKDNVETSLQIDAVHNIAHDPGAERCHAGNNKHCCDRCRVPANVLFEIFFEKPREQLLVVWRQKRSDHGNILDLFSWCLTVLNCCPVNYRSRKTK
ncbi:hypothetical protein D3C87_970830 [compost metagenome]